MITEHEKFKLEDKDGKNDLFAEVNWRPDDPKIKDSQVVKFSLGDKVSYVSRENLMAMLFAIGRPEDQRKMIPVTLKKVRWYETVVSVKASKQINKGENITFPIKLSLPTIEQEMIGEIKKDMQSNKIIVPKN